MFFILLKVFIYFTLYGVCLSNFNHIFDDYINRNIGEFPKWLHNSDEKSIKRYIQTRTNSYQHIVPFSMQYISSNKTKCKPNKSIVKYNEINCDDVIDEAEMFFNINDYYQAAAISIAVLCNNNIELVETQLYHLNEVSTSIQTIPTCIKRALFILSESEREKSYVDSSIYYRNLLISLMNQDAHITTSKNNEYSKNDEATSSNIVSNTHTIPVLLRKILSLSPIPTLPESALVARASMISELNELLVVIQENNLILSLEVYAVIFLCLYAYVYDVSYVCIYLCYLCMLCIGIG